MVQKYVLTGGPGSGKSAIILELERKGYHVVRDAAEDTIHLMQSKGIEKPWENQYFEDHIYNLQAVREQHLEHLAEDEVVFIDRGVLDGMAYRQISGVGMLCKYLSRQTHLRIPYAGVFLIRNLGPTEYKKSKIRRETYGQALQIERRQFINYRDQGYDPVTVPADPLERRVKLILAKLNEKKAIPA
jgi:predicted ATPase